MGFLALLEGSFWDFKTDGLVEYVPALNTRRNHEHQGVNSIKFSSMHDEDIVKGSDHFDL
jgi:hypothetical protein